MKKQTRKTKSQVQLRPFTFRDGKGRRHEVDRLRIAGVSNILQSRDGYYFKVLFQGTVYKREGLKIGGFPSEDDARREANRYLLESK